MGAEVLTAKIVPRDGVSGTIICLCWRYVLCQIHRRNGLALQEFIDGIAERVERISL